MQLGVGNPDSASHTASGTVAVFPVRAETTGFVQTWLEDNRTKYKQVLCSQRWALEDKEKDSGRNIQARLQLLLNRHERVFKSICCSTLKATKPYTRNNLYLSFKCEKNNNLHFTQVMHTEITAPTCVSSLLSPVTVLWNIRVSKDSPVSTRTADTKHVIHHRLVIHSISPLWIGQKISKIK